MTARLNSDSAASTAAAVRGGALPPAVLALALGTAGGALLAWMRLPLAWMIGAMLANAGAAAAGTRVAVPPGLRAAMVMCLGIMLGSAFTPAILGQFGRWQVSLSGLAAYIAVCCLAGTAWLRLAARYDRVTAYFTAMPGGLNEMVLVGGAMGGDERTIALSHSARVMLVVMTVPVFVPVWVQLTGAYGPAARGPLGPGFAALGLTDGLVLAACAIGAPVARRLRSPAAWLVGPMVLSAAVHLAGLTAAEPPGLLIAAAQVVVGAAVGSRFGGLGPRRMGRIVLVAAGLTALLLAVTVGFALALHAATGLPVPALILAYAPGGLAEMSLVALALGVDPAFVSTHHIVRIVLIVILAPAAFTLLRRIAPWRD